LLLSFLGLGAGEGEGRGGVVLPEVPVQQEAASQVRHEVHHAEDSGCEIEGLQAVRRPGLGHRADKLSYGCSYKQKRKHAGHYCFREVPVDGEGDGLPEVEEVHEGPQSGSHEGGHHHEQEPVRARGPGRGGARHAQDAEGQLYELNNSGGGFEVAHIELDARTAGGGGRHIGGGRGGGGGLVVGHAEGGVC